MTSSLTKRRERLQRAVRAELDALSDNSDPNANPPGVVSSSEDEPICATDGCDQSVIPGSDYCGEHSTAWPDAGSPNGGPDGSLSDGTNGPASDANGTWDGTLRDASIGSQFKQRMHRKERHRVHESRATRLTWALDNMLGPEIRADVNKAGTVAVISGLAICYGVRAVIKDSFGRFGEQIEAGAAAHLLGGDIRLLANHDGLPLARTIAGTLALRDTPSGVTFAAELDLSSPTAKDVVSGVKRGDLSGCSFAFTVSDGGDLWNKTMTERTIKRFASIPEISVVTFPAYPSTTVSARSQWLARRAHLQARRDQLERHIKRNELRTGVPMKKRPQPDPHQLPERDDLSAEARAIEKAGELRRAAMQAKGAQSYRSLRVQLNNGRDLEEVRDA